MTKNEDKTFKELFLKCLQQYKVNTEGLKELEGIKKQNLQFFADEYKAKLDILKEFAGKSNNNELYQFCLNNIDNVTKG